LGKVSDDRSWGKGGGLKKKALEKNRINSELSVRGALDKVGEPSRKGKVRIRTCLLLFKAKAMRHSLITLERKTKGSPNTNVGAESKKPEIIASREVRA